MRVNVPAYKRKDGTPVSGYSYDRRRDATQLRRPDRLVGALDGGPPRSALAEQVSPRRQEILEAETERYVNDAVNAVYDDPTTSRLFGGFFAGSGTLLTVGGLAGGAGTLAVSVFGLPFVALGLGFLFQGPIRRRLAAKRMERKLRAERDLPSRRDLLREAEEMIARHPREGPAETQSSTHEHTNNDYTVTSTVSECGLGEVAWERRRSDGSVFRGSLFLYPGANLRLAETGFAVVAPGVSLRGGELSGSHFPEWSNFDGGDLREVSAEAVDWAVSLRGATLAGANLRGALLDRCDMDGVDLTGADVTKAKLPFDLTGTNITREQFESLAFMGDAWDGAPYRVKEATMEQVAAMFGGDRDAATMAIWTGDVEVRERRTGKVVTGVYDPDDHYVPYWAVNS